MSMRRSNYESDQKTFPAPAYSVDGYSGIAWYVRGWETLPDADTEWTGMEVRTGKVIAVMVGDDRQFRFDREDLIPLDREEYCSVCGQVGCAHDGLDRSEQ